MISKSDINAVYNIIIGYNPCVSKEWVEVSSEVTLNLYFLQG